MGVDWTLAPLIVGFLLVGLAAGVAAVWAAVRGRGRMMDWARNRDKRPYPPWELVVTGLGSGLAIALIVMAISMTVWVLQGEPA